MSETHNSAHEFMVIEEPSAPELQSRLNECSRRGFDDVVGLTSAAVSFEAGIGPPIVQWRYTAVVRSSKQISATEEAD